MCSLECLILMRMRLSRIYLIGRKGWAEPLFFHGLPAFGQVVSESGGNHPHPNLPPSRGKGLWALGSLLLK